MERRRFLAAAAGIAAATSTLPAFARFRGGAILDHAVPGVGLTVNGSPRELRLYFDLGVIAAVSAVQLRGPTGSVIPTSKPVNDPSGPQVLVVRLRHALLPGTYWVRWYVISVNNRPTYGAYHFSVA